MRKALVAVVVTLVFVAPLYAGDVVLMPTANMVGNGDLDLHGTKWDLSPNEMTLGQVFYGLSNDIELDVVYADLDNVDDYTELNAYWRICDETAQKPSLILGATNLTESDWLMNEDDMSVFVVSGYTLAAPDVPTWKRPMVRVHLGWGDEFHGEELFGGMQWQFRPDVGAWVYNYKSMPMYGASLRLGNDVSVSGGKFDGETFYRASAKTSW